MFVPALAAPPRPHLGCAATKAAQCTISNSASAIARTDSTAKHCSKTMPELHPTMVESLNGRIDSKTTKSISVK